MEFGRDWRRYCKSETDKYNFLLRVRGEQLGRIFQAEISLGLLGDIITALNSCYQEHHVNDIVTILYTLSQVRRFSLSVQFLSDKEKHTCEKLLQKMEEMVKEEDDQRKEIMGRLRLAYEVNK